MAERLLLGTRKGLVTFVRDGNRWSFARIDHVGIPVAYADVDPRGGRLWASLEHGHWGPKLSRSKDAGETWEDVDVPTFPEGEEISDGKPATLENIWVIGFGGEDELGRIYLGTNPGGLFRSEDDGAHFELVRGLWDHDSRKTGWFGGGRDTPGIHSVVVDPRDSRRVLVGISCAGVFETEDDGKTWRPRNEGLSADFLPDPKAEIGQDPHFVAMCRDDPDRVWQQNHCGVFRSTDSGRTWTDVGQNDGPVRFGFPVAVHARRGDTAWVVPAVDDGKRLAIDGALVVCRTEDGGETWTELRKGLPQSGAFDLVYRHALDIDGDQLAFGSTTGNLFWSGDGGDSWVSLSNHLPPIYSVRFA